MRNYFKSGDWNAICDKCGFKFKASQLRKDWQGLMVCHADYEQRHTLDFIRGIPDPYPVPWTRDEPGDSFIYVCYLEASYGLADQGEADCARADKLPAGYILPPVIVPPVDPIDPGDGGYYCTLFASQGISDTGEADCSRADTTI